MDTLCETPGMESAGPEREPSAESATNPKATELNYNQSVTTASSAQYTHTTKKRQWRGEVQKRQREKDNPVCRKSTHTKDTNKRDNQLHTIRL